MEEDATFDEWVGDLRRWPGFIMTDELRAVPKGISGAFLGEHKQIDAIDDVNRKNYADGTTENERGSGWAGSLSGTEAYRKSLFNTGLSGSSNEGDL